jgi:hypothetical protein
MFKYHLLLCFCVVSFNYAAAQLTPPLAFNYSAVARDTLSQPIASKQIGIQISILKTAVNGTNVYTENHFVFTDAFGLFNLTIGSGIVQSGNMGTIAWSTDNYFLKISMDASGGTNFLWMGTSQLLSVPYALHSATADSLVGGIANENDPVFNASVASGITAADTTNWNNKQDSVIAGNGIIISGDTVSSLLSSGNVFIHYIGKPMGGGVVYHLWKDSLGVEHGLIVDLVELSPAQNWSNILSTAIGSTARSSWNGLSNCIAIVNQAGHTASAASLCINSNNGGQTDWYLPSIDELSLLWRNRYVINKTLSTINGATELLLNNIYWSCTEFDHNTAIAFNYLGNLIYNSKSSPRYVRAIRSF